MIVVLNFLQQRNNENYLIAYCTSTTVVYFHYAIAVDCQLVNE